MNECEKTNKITTTTTKCTQSHYEQHIVSVYDGIMELYLPFGIFAFRTVSHKQQSVTPTN